MLHLILADSELERVPPEIASHRVIRWHARKKGRKATELLLDSSLHYPAMRKLEDNTRRGRPDIVHLCLTLALDSPLNLEKLLGIYVHTRNDELITFDPAARLPKSYNRFVGLMEQLFLAHEVPPAKPLLQLKNGNLAEIVRGLEPKKTIAFSDKGKPTLYSELYDGLKLSDDVCVIIGGFPHGDFKSDVKKISDELVCIDPELLHASSVMTRAIYAYEEKFEIQKKRLGVLHEQKK